MPEHIAHHNVLQVDHLYATCFHQTEIPFLDSVPLPYYRIEVNPPLVHTLFSTLVTLLRNWSFSLLLYLQVQVHYPIHWCSYQHPQLTPTTKSLPQCCIVLYSMRGLFSSSGCVHGSPTHSYYTMNHSYTVVHVSLHVYSHYCAVNQSHAVQ